MASEEVPTEEVPKYDYLVRKATEFDLDTVVDMMLDIFRETNDRIVPGDQTRGWLRAQFYQALNWRGVCLIADLSGYAIGMTLAVEADLPYNTRDTKTVIGHGTFVKRGFRRRGVADRLYDTLKDILEKESPPGTLYLGSYRNDNEAVQGVLERNGLRGFQTLVKWEF